MSRLSSSEKIILVKDLLDKIDNYLVLVDSDDDGEFDSSFKIWDDIFEKIKTYFGPRRFAKMMKHSENEADLLQIVKRKCDKHLEKWAKQDDFSDIDDDDDDEDYQPNNLV